MTTRSRVRRASPGTGATARSIASRNGASRSVFLTVEQAVKRIHDGRMIIVVDDAARENEGDLVFAAEKATPAMVNFAVKYGRGILCAASYHYEEISEARTRRTKSRSDAQTSCRELVHPIGVLEVSH